MKWEVVKNRGDITIRNEKGHIVADVDDEDLADLIAAAPEMLAALEAIAALDKAGGEVPCSAQNDAWAKVHAAIARARGES